MSKEGTIKINDDMNITISSTTKVTCNDKLIMIFPGGKKEELNVKIEADFKDLKPEHHQIFFDSLSRRYNHHILTVGRIKLTKVFNSLISKEFNYLRSYKPVLLIRRL